MLTSLSAKNFKSWELIDRMRLAPITGLFGANSSGKTSIIQLLLLLKQTVASTDKAQVFNFGGDLASLGTFRDAVFAHDVDRPVSVSLEWGESEPIEIQDPEGKRTDLLFSGSELAFSTVVTGSEHGRLSVERMDYRLGRTQFSMARTRRQEYTLSADAEGFRFIRAMGRKWPLPAPVKCYGFPDQVRGYFQNAGFVSQLELAFEQLLGRTYYLGPLRVYPQREYTWAGGMPEDVGTRGERVVDALLASRSRGKTNSRGHRKRRMTLEEHVAVWLQELGLIDSFEVEQIREDSSLYRVNVRKSRTSTPVLITDVGFGVSQILPVLTLCFFVPEGSIVILEQPEIHLHPSVQAGLADVLIEAARVRNIQIIVESHSEHLLQRLQRRVAEDAVDHRDLALYFCEATGGRSSLRELDVNILGEITNWPSEFFGDPFGEVAKRTLAAHRRRREGGG